MTIIWKTATAPGVFFMQGLLCVVWLASLRAQELANTVDLPKVLAAKDFSELMKNSPFTRSLDLSDSLILTGVAKVEGKAVATLMNKETKETYVISESPNAQGWKMVEISDEGGLEKVTAKIALSGGEVVTVRFDEAQLKPGEAKPAAGPGGDQKTDRKEGRRRHPGGGPPPEMIAKLRTLTDEQRGKLREYMIKEAQGNPDMTRDERRALLEKAMGRLTAGGKKKQ